MKTTKHRSLHLVLLALLVFDSLASGQEASQARNKEPRRLEDYQRRTLKEIAALKPDASDLRDKQGRLVVTADILPSMAQVTYTGSTRFIPQFKKETIRQWARLYAGSMEHYTGPYQTEMLFIEAGKRYWLVVNENSGLARHTIRAGQALSLYLIRLGAAIAGDKYDWTLLVEDFREAGSSGSAAEINFNEMRFGRPPLKYLSFYVLLRNDRKSPRWFMLPSNLGPGHAAIGEKGGVDALEVFAPRGKGRVIVGHFLGTGGFHALRLPPGAEVRLRRFPISYWGEPPANLQIEVVVARQLRIGGQKAERWFPKNPMSSVRADISEEAESPRAMMRSTRTPDNKEVAAVMTVDRKLQLQVPLERKPTG